MSRGLGDVYKRQILGDRYSEEVAVITDADVTTDVAITTLLSDFIKKGG